jgi:hypothetical protein
MKAKIVCPNRATAEWKSLVEGLNDEAKAFLAFFRNGDSIPDVATAWKLLSPKKKPAESANPPHADHLQRPSRFPAMSRIERKKLTALFRQKRFYAGGLFSPSQLESKTRHGFNVSVKSSIQSNP